MGNVGERGKEGKDGEDSANEVCVRDRCCQRAAWFGYYLHKS